MDIKKIPIPRKGVQKKFKIREKTKNELLLYYYVLKAKKIPTISIIKFASFDFKEPPKTIPYFSYFGKMVVFVSEDMQFIESTTKLPQTIFEQFVKFLKENYSEFKDAPTIDEGLFPKLNKNFLWNLSEKVDLINLSDLVDFLNKENWVGISKQLLDEYELQAKEEYSTFFYYPIKQVIIVYDCEHNTIITTIKLPFFILSELHNQLIFCEKVIQKDPEDLLLYSKPELKVFIGNKLKFYESFTTDDALILLHENSQVLRTNEERKLTIKNDLVKLNILLGKISGNYRFYTITSIEFIKKSENHVDFSVPVDVAIETVKKSMEESTENSSVEKHGFWTKLLS